MSTATLSRRPLRRFWGWGLADEALGDDERRLVQGLLAQLPGGVADAVAEPRVEDFTLPPPRVPRPEALAHCVSGLAHDRLSHAYGKSYADLARMLMRHVPHAPDWVAYPADEDELIRVLEWAGREQLAVVPYGGGSSVVGGVEPDVGDGWRGSVTVDLERFDRVRQVDPTSRSALIDAGCYGPDLEAQLRPHDLTLRYYPQSFRFSTLGGWIATRAGGHYATQATRIDAFVQATRLVTPAGLVQTRRLPGSGAGPSVDGLVLGCEGSFGIVTQAWMRLQPRPRYRASASVRFAALAPAVAAVRAIAQSGLQPANCRLLDSAEVAFAGVGDRRSPTLVLGFESADHPLQAWMARALELVADHGGRFDADAVQRSMAPPDSADAAEAAEHRQGAAGQWRDAFLRMPYWRDEAARHGVILDTFETAITWDRFDAFYAAVREEVGDAIRRVTGQPMPVSCRFTHVYPDGPALYFTVVAATGPRGGPAGAWARWREIKAACNAAVVRHGGTSTHHHAVGRDHRSAYEAEVPALMRAALAAAKAQFDPQGLMNPGVLLEPQGRPVGIRGGTVG